MIIETKARGLAEDPHRPQGGDRESAKEQLDRYVLNEIREELGSFNWDPENRSNDPWIGVVTDGRAWHSWRYPHTHDPEIETLHSTTVQNADALMTALKSVFGNQRSAKQWVPVTPAGLFEDHAAELKRLYQELPPDVQRRKDTKQRLWLDMLQVSGITPEAGKIDQLFVTHSLLIAIARIVTRTLTAQRREWQSALKDGFVSWITDSHIGVEWADELRRTIEAHDWKRRRQDVMQSLYMTFVSAADRKVFGEYYTPDWLAALIVQEALDDAWLSTTIERAESARRRGQRPEGMGVLDPTCGSGTFLYHAARRILAAPAMRVLTATQQADITAGLVHGIDVHPVAVEIAKTNMMRVLPTPPTMGDAALQIRMGDSLIADDDARRLFDVEGTMRLVTPRGRDILLPMNFVRQHGFADDMGRVVSAAVEGAAVPGPVLETLEAGDRKGLEEACAALAKAIEEEGNSVWTWYAVNIAAPRLLSEQKVDRIVANPPWVKLAEIQHEPRKRAMEAFGKRLKIYQGGKQAPHTDIAAFFIQRTRELYLQDPKENPGIWLVKKSSLKGGQWDAFRERHKDTLAQSIDLEELQPFGGGDATRCCLLFEHRAMAGMEDGARELRALRKIDERTQSPMKRPQVHETSEAARERIRFVQTVKRIPRAPSGYLTPAGKPVFRQGATVLPQVLTIAERTEVATDTRRIRVTTRESSKPPWNTVRPRTVEIPKRWLVKLCTSSMVAFTTRTVKAIIPLDEHRQPAHQRARSRKTTGGCSTSCTEATWRQGDRRRKRSCNEIDHVRALSAQLPLTTRESAKTGAVPGLGRRDASRTASSRKRGGGTRTLLVPGTHERRSGVSDGTAQRNLPTAGVQRLTTERTPLRPPSVAQSADPAVRQDEPAAQGNRRTLHGGRENRRTNGESGAEGQTQARGRSPYRKQYETRWEKPGSRAAMNGCAQRLLPEHAR